MPNSSENRGLRLTLRTLLAWLDDQLPPTEVRQIGQQVTESPFAKELIARIQKVSRRRRLTVPPDSGPDSIDPALVASYLDNELPPEQVADYEKRCLTSDVNLAEVASCHQILSMIGQKAKVPPEARLRMYRLIKGREAVGRASNRPAPPPVAPPSQIEPWTAAPLPARSLVERFALPAGVLALIVLMGVSAWMLAPTGREGVPAPAATTAAVPAPESQRPKPENAPAPPAAAVPAESEAPQAPEAAAPIETPEEAKPAGDEAVASRKDANEPAAVGEPRGTIKAADAVVLRWDPNSRSWTRIPDGDPLRRDDRLVCLEPFRMAVQMGAVGIELIGPTEVRWPTPAAGEAVRLELLQGQVVLNASEADQKAAVLTGGKALSVTLPPKQPVGFMIVATRAPGQPARAPSLMAFVVQGEVPFRAGTAAETVSGPGAVEFLPPDRLVPRVQDAAPSWMTAEGPTPVERATGKAFASFFKPEEPTTKALVEAVADDQESMRTLALSALSTLGDIRLIIPELEHERDPKIRAAAIRTLRAYASRSPEAAKTLHDQLAQFNGDAWASVVEKLLNGYTPEDEKNPAVHKELVKLLSDPDLGVRELALGQLVNITGRDTLGYDPDRPEGPGLRAWQELLRSDELRAREKAEPAKSAKPGES